MPSVPAFSHRACSNTTTEPTSGRPICVFGWLQASNTGLFVVYDDTRAIGDSLFSEPDRSLFIKLSWLFDVLG